HGSPPLPQLFSRSTQLLPCPPMTLPSALAPFVDSKVRQRGLQYFREHRVRLLFCDSRRVEAIVSGSSPYNVVLNREIQFLWSSCSCPYFERGEPCKHIWAAILAADSKGGLQSPDGAIPLRLMTVAAAATRGAESGDGSTARALVRPLPPPAK